MSRTTLRKKNVVQKAVAICSKYQIEPQMISEDFACYGSEVPICCALLGVGSPVGLHSAAFCPDSSVLLPAARFLAESAWSVLEDARA